MGVVLSFIKHTVSPSSSSSFTEEPKHGGTVLVHALSAGHFSLPEEQFVSPCTEGARKTVPSLCFLIQHRRPGSNKTTRIVFDLGLRRDVNRYSEPIRQHTKTRQPMTTDPDVVKSLKRGGLTADDIDYVIYSHVSHSNKVRCGLVRSFRWERVLILKLIAGSLGPCRRAPRFPKQQIHRRQRVSGLALRERGQLTWWSLVFRSGPPGSISDFSTF